jgi:hypothetical protein
MTKIIVSPWPRALVGALAIGALVASIRIVTQSAAVPIVTSVSPTFGAPGTMVTITGTNFGTDLNAGKIGWWGPFKTGVAPNNLIPGRPNARFIGNPVFTADGGGGFRSTATDYLEIPDGGAGGTYDWTSGAWSVQVNFAFPATPVWGSIDHFLLVSKGSFNQGTGWEVQVTNTMFQGKYQIMLESNHGVNKYNLISSYLVVPGTLNRALFICDAAGKGTWYVNGASGAPQTCAPTFSGATPLVVGRYSDQPAYASNFPITRVQIWNRALTATDAAVSTTTDPIPSTVTFNGVPAAPTSWTDTTITVPVPAGTTTGPVVVSVGGVASSGVTFSIPPSLTGLSPLEGAVGSIVTISGTNFGAAQGTGFVSFNGITAIPTSWSPASIQATVPAGATTGPVRVTTSAGLVSNPISYTVTSPPQAGAASLLDGKHGWWGPFRAAEPPTNRIAGKPNGVFVGQPAFTTDGGGAFVSTATDYLRVPDGAAGGTYDWTAGGWSAQVDFTFPSVPEFPNGPFLLLSKGSFAQGNGWELQVNDSTFQGKYQAQAIANRGTGNYRIVTSYLVAPGALNRALFVCDAAGSGTWYVNGTAGIPQPCAPAAAGPTDLIIGRYSDQPAYASNFPITRVQIWNRALTETESISSTTTDPDTAAVPPVIQSDTAFSISGTIAPASAGRGTIMTLGGAATATTVADSAGHYSFPSLANGTYAVMPGPGYTLTPASRTVTVAGANVNEVDFTVAVANPTYSITGTVTPDGAGATITLSETSQTTTADSAGAFLFAGMARGTYTVVPSKPGYAFAPGTRSVTINESNVVANFTATSGPTADRANSYDNAWKAAWVARARTLLRTPGKTDGFVLQIGDEMTRSPSYALWASQGQGQTAADSQVVAWVRAATWSVGHYDVTSKNGWYLAAAETTGQRGMTASIGLTPSTALSGCCNGGPVMPATSDPVAARQILTDLTYAGNMQIDTILSAFQDAQFAVVTFGTDPGNPQTLVGLTTIVDKLEAQRIVPILSTIPPQRDAGAHQQVVQLNDAIRTLARTRSLPLIDFYQEIVLRRPGTTWIGTLISSDGVTPSIAGAGYSTVANPYQPGGDPATSTTGEAATNVGYLLRSWLTIQKLKEVKLYVIDGINP